MDTKVVDASAVAAVLFGEPEAEFLASSMQGARLAAPGLLRFEVGSACRKKLRLHPESREALLGALRLLDQLEVQEVEIPIGEAVLLAESEGLTVYDAAYLWLARALGAELVTLDTGLLRAAQRRYPPGVNE